MYLTFLRRTDIQQYSFEKQYAALRQGQELPLDRDLPYKRTHTVEVETASLSTGNQSNMYVELQMLTQKYNRWDNRTDYAVPAYTQFMIPKRSGGLRTIDAPHETLKELQSAIAEYFQKVCKMHSHDAAFAYIPGRCALHAVQKHKNNRWFLKLDIQDFFPSMTIQFVQDTLKQLFPLAVTWDELVHRKLLQYLDVCFLRGALPQGSPASPLLSNLCMIPFDTAINKALQDFDGHNFTYTRYADDMLISASHDFDWHKVQDLVQSKLGTTFRLKQSKTRYASNSGRNWNLGLMLNQDNNITVGHARKERTKAMMFSLMKDGMASTLTLQELQVLQGEIAYVASIEPAYIQALDAKYQNKLQSSSYAAILKQLIKARLP